MKFGFITTNKVQKKAPWSGTEKRDTIRWKRYYNRLENTWRLFFEA